MKYKGFTLVEAIVVIVILAIIAAVLFPVFARQRESCGPRHSCTSNLKQIGLGMIQYVQDYDEKFPPARNATGGWAELVQPYIKSYQIFQCPSEASGAGKTTDYYYNARLSGLAANLNTNTLLSPTATIMTGDGLANQPLDYSLSQLPAAWRTDESSPAWRHLERANYLFVDGHVKTLNPAKITLDKPSTNHPTFLVKP